MANKFHFVSFLVVLCASSVPALADSAPATTTASVMETLTAPDWRKPDYPLVRRAISVRIFTLTV